MFASPLSAFFIVSVIFLLLRVVVSMFLVPVGVIVSPAIVSVAVVFVALVSVAV